MAILWRLGSAALLAACGIAALAHPGHPPIPTPTAHYEASRGVSFQLFRDQRILLDGHVNGHAASMMLDSGASMTVIDRAFADSIGLKGSQALPVRGATGEVAAEMATNVTLEAGGLELSGMSVLILDMAAVERAVGRKIPVILGHEAFKAGIVSIDFPSRRIRFSDRTGFAPPEAATRLELGERGRIFSVKVGISGLDPVEADLDLGNGGTMLLAQSYWTAQPRLGALRHAESQIGGVSGMTRARKVTLPSVELAGRSLADVPAVLNEDPQALPRTGANVGLAMLKSYKVTFDAAGGALYLEGMDRPPSFERERVGARFELDGNRLHTAYVSPDGPAAAAGLKAGDEIVAVASRRIDADYYARPDWTHGPAGKQVTLERADGSRITVTLTDYY